MESAADELSNEYDKLIKGGATADEARKEIRAIGLEMKLNTGVLTRILDIIEAKKQNGGSSGNDVSDFKKKSYDSMNQWKNVLGDRSKTASGKNGYSQPAQQTTTQPQERPWWNRPIVAEPSDKRDKSLTLSAWSKTLGR